MLNRAREDDAYAKEELIKKYTPMVRHIVRKNYKGIVEFEDMMQEGLIGLLNAINEYNFYDYSVKFSSFAYLCIIRKIYNIIRQTNNYKNRSLNSAISLQTYIDNDDSRVLMDFITSDQVDPEEIVEEKWVSQKLDKMLKNHLSLLEYVVIALLLKGYTTSEIENEVGINSKSVDNARTRIKFKLQRILSDYGSLLSPKIPQKVRKRSDLSMNLKDVLGTVNEGTLLL